MMRRYEIYCKVSGEYAVVRKGTAFLAYLLPGFWLAYNRLLIHAVIYVLLMDVAFLFIAHFIELDNERILFFLKISFKVVLGLKAGEIHAWIIKRQGFIKVDEVEANNRKAAFELHLEKKERMRRTGEPPKEAIFSA